MRPHFMSPLVPWNRSAGHKYRRLRLEQNGCSGLVLGLALLAAGCVGGRYSSEPGGMFGNDSNGTGSDGAAGGRGLGNALPGSDSTPNQIDTRKVHGYGLPRRGCISIGHGAR
jgi:hypothetical protein